MSGSLNRILAIGNLGADPEIRQTKDGKPVASFNIACTERWKSRDTGQPQERTEWIPVVCFSEGLCRVAEAYLKKGSRVLVEGKFTTRRWTDQSGVERFKTECVLQGFDGKLLMLDSKGDGQSSPRPQAAQQPARDFSQDLDDEVPF